MLTHGWLVSGLTLIAACGMGPPATDQDLRPFPLSEVGPVRLGLPPEQVLDLRPNATRAEDYLLIEMVRGYRVQYIFDGFYSDPGSNGLREVMASRPMTPADNTNDLLKGIRIKGTMVCREFEAKDTRIVYRGIASQTEEILVGIEPPYITPTRSGGDTNPAVVGFRWRKRQDNRPYEKLVACDTRSVPSIPASHIQP